MAPSATETVTVTQPPLKLHSTTSGTGDYKQLQAHNVDRDAEEGKKEGIKGAKVRSPKTHACSPSFCLEMDFSSRFEDFVPSQTWEIGCRQGIRSILH